MDGEARDAMAATLEQHPQRLPLTNELHARPFQAMAVPGRVLHLAFKPPERAAERDPRADFAHLKALIDRYGGQPPADGASHYVQDFGRFQLKWERHTEFVSYTICSPGAGEVPFDSGLLDIFDGDWLSGAPGRVIAAVSVEILAAASRDEAEALTRQMMTREFSAESVAIARVLDDNALAMGDFRVHEQGLSRFAVVLHGPSGPRRVGRLVQRLIEIETYRTLAMLTLPVARELGPQLNEAEAALTGVIDRVARESGDDAEILTELIRISAGLEAMAAQTAFRFGALGAYEALVHARIESLQEARQAGRQMFAEFMQRRFVPAMRTCHATERRLEQLTTRAGRAAELLRTRVNVSVEAQNQLVLSSMDRRAALQLRLQETVEGLSVVAISYYAVGLATNLLAPLAPVLGLDKTVLKALIVLPVLWVVWWSVRKLRARLGGH